MPLFGRDLGIDLGTTNTLICEGSDIVLHEPTVVAIDVDELKIVEVGQAAREMDGRVPESIQVMRPLRDGVIADFEVTQRMLGHFIEKQGSSAVALASAVAWLIAPRTWKLRTISANAAGWEAVIFRV